MKISVVTVAYNSEKTIAKTIESILAQESKEGLQVEYLIIDGASTDATVQVAESYRSALEEKGVEFVVSSEPDKGIYDAMNKGIAKATGDVVGILNSDDWYENHTLRVVAETYETTNFDMMYANIRLLKENGDCILKKAKLGKYITSRHWNHPTTFITKEVYNKFSYRTDNLYADLDMLIKIRKAGYHVEIVDQVLANFRMGGASNVKTFEGMKKRIKFRYNVYRSNGYSPLCIFECLLMDVGKFILS